MTRNIVILNAGRLVALMAISLLTLATAIPPARAQVDASEGTVVATYEDADPGAEVERWWGVAGAVICGAEIRIIRVAPAIGMNPYMIAAGVAGCLLAGLDILTTE